MSKAETTSSTSTSTEVPKTRMALEEKYKDMGSTTKKSVDETNVADIKDELPTPSGWRLLVLPFTPKEKSKGGILIAQETLDKYRIAVNCGYVIKMGPLAYKDKEKFESGPWCKEGDWVIITKYAGSRLMIDGGELRIINEDEVQAVVDDPRDILPPNLI